MTAVIASLKEGQRLYGSRVALQMNNLEILRNDCLAVYGRNGSGKSTLLRVLCGLTKLSAGRLETTSDWRRGRIAYCPQSGGLYGDLTLAENVTYLSRRVWGRSTNGNFEELVETTALGDAVNVQIAKLSGGYQKLAMIAASLAIKAEILILDEPSSDLHPSYVGAVANILAKSSEQYLAIVFADHSEELIKVAKRKIEMS
jgi:ABC-type multidrug transport system ATPase subunit